MILRHVLILQINLQIENLELVNSILVWIQNFGGKTMPDQKKENESQKQKLEKAPYVKPAIITEELTAVAAVCNGKNGSGKKASTSSPNFCSTTKLKS